MLYLYLLLLPLVTAIQWFPLDSDGNIPKIQPYLKNQEIFFDCIQRNIDNGEHKFDQQNKIIYGPFPKCKETQKPFVFEYGINEDLNCTIQFTDELYHLFQLYIHEDVPFSCRLPLSSEVASLEKGGAFIPFTFNFRGEITDSHIDIDHSLNVIITKPNEQNTFISAVAYGSGTNTTRVVIGDEVTLNFAIRWLDQLKVVGSKGYDLPYKDGFYKFETTTSIVSLFYVPIACIITAVIVFLITYKKRRYQPLDIEKKD
ncbi:uncharacterized protein KGF55_004890 [Candida pseudojiufengensis]|uniref:uncharacterized protein n=1 Tax=Candida pseudojiufengensis TaxID=497109 RepID=UPI0022242EA5|nr:uncharacterized protein KGF55_004890 [Candida pseudojiufengensis]KAI5960167.1 hypothetical protein KGF55_004890 [Candida pseudojiufengensis]